MIHKQIQFWFGVNYFFKRAKKYDQNPLKNDRRHGN